MSYIRELIRYWTREDILFASAVVPGALTWILFESLLFGLFVWALAYAAIIGAYEYVAEKKRLPHSAAYDLVQDVIKFYHSRH